MNDFIRRFKNIVAQVADESGVNFRHYGFSDLLLELGNNPTPAEIVGSALFLSRRRRLQRIRARSYGSNANAL